MKIIDTHAHYDDSQFDNDRDELLKRILDESVEAIINIGCDIESSRFSIDLSHKYQNIFAAVGIHPENCDNVPDNYIELLKEMAKDNKVKAIGEIGLDYHYEGYSAEKQQEVFIRQLILADELSLPVIIHSRDATEDTMRILKEVKPQRAVMHCFSGSAETAAELLKLGIYISFTGVLTFKNAKKAVKVCEIIPLDRLMTETDSPYMAPVPHRGERCDSSLTHFTAGKIAEIKGISYEEAVRTCNENAVRFFNLDFDR